MTSPSPNTVDVLLNKVIDIFADDPSGCTPREVAVRFYEDYPADASEYATELAFRAVTSQARRLLKKRTASERVSPHVAEQLTLLPGKPSQFYSIHDSDSETGYRSIGLLHMSHEQMVSAKAVLREHIDRSNARWLELDLQEKALIPFFTLGANTVAEALEMMAGSLV